MPTPELPPVTLADTVTWSDRQLATDICGQTVVMSLSASTYCGLDDIGSDIWRRLARPATVANLCAALVRDYQATADVIEADVLPLLEQMRAQGIIDVRS
ncbi:MAG: PqqD family protein [Azospirillaceae bacterium]|nr:PqqD family protein [Azospirillaceae bacterium]